jgi:cytidylate kinase
MRLRITIARQMGSGGSSIGQLLAEKLNCKYIDREILRLTAEQHNCNEQDVVVRAEMLSSFWERNFSGLMLGHPEAKYTPLRPLPVSDRSLFDTQVEILKAMVEDCDCVIAGYAAAFVLPYHAGVFNIFCHAPLHHRIKRVKTVNQIKTEHEARLMIERADDARRKYVKSMIGKEWTDASNYHMTIDTSYHSFQETTDLILEFLRTKGVDSKRMS